MSRIFNFSAGPSTLPLEVLQRARDEFVEYDNSGMSLIEMSHRSKPYDAVHNKAIELLKQLLGLNDDYFVLFLGGGATMQFSMAPMNILQGERSCDLTLTGSWAKKALAGHKPYGKVNVVYDGSDCSFTSLPDAGSMELSPGATYLHLTSNETIGGVQWMDFPKVNVPLVSDMSSDFLSRSIPVDRFGLIYAGAQKNVGPAGVGIVIIRKDVLEMCSDDLPLYLSYKQHAAANSLLNTPPVFQIWMIKLVLEWLIERGGLQWAADMAEQRSKLLYDMIATHSEFYRCPVDAKYRSKMNVVWRCPSEDLEKQFIAEADKQGMSGLKGHRSVGGCRASIYNAMPLEGAQALAQFMDEFAKKNG
jgi:phosphoserine aminotransferase